MVFVPGRIVSLDLQRDGHRGLGFRHAHFNTPKRDRQFFRDLGSGPVPLLAIVSHSPASLAILGIHPVEYRQAGTI